MRVNIVLRDSVYFYLKVSAIIYIIHVYSRSYVHVVYSTGMNMRMECVE